MTALEEAYDYYRRLRAELSTWLDQSELMDGPGRHGGGEDEANYSLTWFPHYLVTGEERVPQRFRSLLADLENWVETDCYHGYEPVAEAHHGTEPFLLFLPRYHGLFPEDETATRLIEDSAHHIGNWVEGIPDWYDYGRDCFHGYHIGTKEVGGDDDKALELAEHFRFIHIALAAYRALGEERYLEWSLRYGRKRAQQILDVGEGPLPVVWDQTGRGLSESDLSTRSQQGMGGIHHHVPADPLAGIENLLASGAIYALGDLYLLSGEDVFPQAARRIAEPLVDELLDPYTDPGAAAVSYYRWTFADPSLDERIRDVLAGMPEESEEPLAMVFPQEYKRRGPGVGKRADMIYWGYWSEDGSATPYREPCTATLTLAYQLTGDPVYAKRALKAAAVKFIMARRVLRGGREHADMGGAICSVAAGHGRNWGQGAVTGCYGPLLLGTREIQSKVSPLVEVQDGDGNARLPEEILALVVPPVTEPGQLFLFNGGEQTVNMSWRRVGVGSAEWDALSIEPGDTCTFELAALQERKA